jgi:sulfate transport system permease protein
MSARAAPSAPLSRPHPLLTAFTLLTVAALVLLPILALVAHGLGQGPAAAFAAITRPEASAALALTLGLALCTTLCNGVVGLGVAWALVRWEFPGKGLLAALVDLPLSVPTLVAGFLIVALYGPMGPLAPALAEAGLQVIYARPALLLALLFITFPFVVRAVEPVLAELDPTEEAAAATLGASQWQTFRWVLLPALTPALAAGGVAVAQAAAAPAGASRTTAVPGSEPGTPTSPSMPVIPAAPGPGDRSNDDERLALQKLRRETAEVLGRSQRHASRPRHVLPNTSMVAAHS